MNDAELRSWHLAYEDEIAAVADTARQQARCATCRWWDQDDTNLPHEDPDIVPGWGQCQRTYGKNAKGSRALTFTFDPYVTLPLFTAPDFGCAQHESHRDVPDAESLR